jgi:hypothetical protein
MIRLMDAIVAWPKIAQDTISTMKMISDSAL